MFEDDRSSEYGCYETEEPDLDEYVFDAIPLDILRENISAQIHGDTMVTSDFMQMAVNRFNMILNDKLDIDYEEKCNLQDEIISFCHDVINEILGNYGIAYDFPYDEESNIFIDIASNVYNFFILNKFRMTEQMIINFIRTNKSMIISDLGLNNYQSDDVTSLSNKQKNIDDSSIAILSHIDSIINEITDVYYQNISAVDFINLLDDKDVYTENILGYYNNGYLIGDFTYPFLQESVSEYSSYNTSRIRANIRTAFFTGSDNY